MCVLIFKNIVYYQIMIDQQQSKIISSQEQEKETNGAFLFKDKEDNEICLFLFYKFNPEQLKLALPNTDQNIPGDYFVGIWKKGIDYLGKTEYNGILSIKKQEDLVDINSNYDKIFELLNITKDEHDKYKNFVSKHIKTFESIKDNVP